MICDLFNRAVEKLYSDWMGCWTLIHGFGAQPLRSRLTGLADRCESHCAGRRTMNHDAVRIHQQGFLVHRQEIRLVPLQLSTMRFQTFHCFLRFFWCMSQQFLALLHDAFSEVRWWCPGREQWQRWILFPYSLRACHQWDFAWASVLGMQLEKGT